MFDDRRKSDVLKAIGATAAADLWHQGPPLAGALRRVTAAQAAWKPNLRSHSIWELTLHCAYWKYAIRRRITGGKSGEFPLSPANWPEVPEDRGEQSWRETKKLLNEMHEQLLAAVQNFDPARLDQRPPDKKTWTYAELLHGSAYHDIYHTGQIQLLKKIMPK